MIDLEKDKLIACHCQSYKDIKLIIFGFILQEAQLHTLYTLFYKQRDFLLITKTSFSKSLIFQLLLFIYDSTEVVIILIAFKLL